MVLYWFFYSLLNQMSSDSPGDPYQKEHKLVDKCIEKQQVHPDVVQPEIIAGSYRPLIFLFIRGWAFILFIWFLFTMNSFSAPCTCSEPIFIMKQPFTGPRNYCVSYNPLTCPFSCFSIINTKPLFFCTIYMRKNCFSRK
jgi:hypothetical protein